MTSGNIQVTIDVIISKIDKLALLLKNAQNENFKLKAEREQLLKTLEDKKNIINNLEEKNKRIKLAKSLTAAGGSTQRHPGVHPEPAGLVGRARHDLAGFGGIATAADDYRQADQLRVAAQLDRVRAWAGRREAVRLATRNSFPAAAGLASSASGFAALTLAAVRAFEGCALKRTNHDGTPERGFVDCDPKDGRLSRRFVEIT